jgi:alternate signal-mediated exported protein
MASKSKKRRRVLGASCILAALIIAGSSFAWFTSKDEVTNRLTANADYGVSIVESFVPPQNMIPGQQVNKDVYAVNTGTIGAFVKETVSGVLNYTYEKRVAEAPTGDATHDKDYVELSDGRARAIDGATTNEAGGYLAYFKAANGTDTVDLGPVNSATITDANDAANNPGQVEGDRWHPTKTGTYIFKRSIIPAQDAVPAGAGYDPNFDTNHPTATEEEKAANEALAPKAAVPEKYTYAGYYYVADANPAVEGKYYKIVIGEDPFRAAKESYNATTGVVDWEFDISVDSDNLGTGVTVNEKGEIVGEPLIQYVKDVVVKDATPHLTYHNTGSDASPTTAYLEAWYTDGTAGASSADYTNKQQALANAEAEKATAYTALLEATGTAAEKEIDYENKLGAYNTALSRYQQALADYNYAKALQDATSKLVTAANTRGAAEKAKDDARDAMDAALTALKNEATTLETDARTDKTVVGTDTGKFGDLISLGDDTETTSPSTVSKEINISWDSIFKTQGTNGSLYDIITAGAAGNASNQPLMTQAKNYMGQMETKWGQITSAADRLGTALNNFDSLNSDGAWNDAAKAQEYRDELYAAQANLAQLLKDYEELYTALTTVAASEPALTQLNSTGATTKALITGWKNRAGALKTRMDVDSTNAVPAASPTGTEGIDFKTKDYIAKYNAYVTQVTETIPAADTAWMTAVNTYNDKVGTGTYTENGVEKDGAKKAYTTAIQTDQKRYDTNNNLAKNNYEGLTTDGTTLVSSLSTPADKAAASWYLTDNGQKLVSIYSVERHNTAAADPTVTSADDTSTSVAADKSLANLWKVISADGSLDATAGSGYVGSMTETKESKYERNGESGATENKYTSGTYADIAADTAFKTLVANGTEYATVSALKNALGTEESGLLKELNDAETAYTNAVTNLGTANTNYTNATNAVDDARDDATTAAKSDDSSISIIIYLDDIETNGSPLNWTPSIADGETADEVAFFYNYILGPGETSDKLIDAVALNKEMGSKDYKSLVFDLNVKLDSAQITYAADQKTITSDAVTQEGFGNTATVQPAAADGRVPVQWTNASATPATPKIYRVGLTTVDAPIGRAKIVSTVVEGKNFVYELTYDGKTYFGETNTDGSVFYEANDSKTDAKDATSKIVLSVK